MSASVQCRVRSETTLSHTIGILGRLVLAVTGMCHAVEADDLSDLLQPVVNAHRGDVAVVVRHLETGAQFTHRETIVQPTASLIKLPVMVAAYRQVDAGQLDLKKRIELQNSDKVPGSGVLTDHFSEGLQVSVRDAIRLMIRYSDNTATNLVVRQIGLPFTSDTMAALGFPETRLHAMVYRGDTSIAPERSKLYGLGSTTALEMTNLLQGLFRNQVASEDSCKAMLDHLLSCEDRAMLPRELPEGIRIAHKTGAVGNSRCDAGIIYSPKGPIAICVLTTHNEDQSWKAENAAHVLMGRIARLSFDHFNPAWEAPDPSLEVSLKTGAFGKRVEFLQRTLNARMQPSPGLGVDGDFGPATEAAVRQFEGSNGLTVDGIVDADFWKYLGPIVDEESIPSPDVIQSEVLPREPMDSLEGPPFVSAKAWTIVDAGTGKELAGFDSHTPRDFASTTKMMTAWLVAEYASGKPEVLDEVLTMSVRADETKGSTSGLRAGEQTSIREALFGLMLPSGNDMSVALAEHFGERVAYQPSETLPASADPLDRFVAVMNLEAARLGMTNSSFRNPHGLTQPDHTASASDLARLGRMVLSNPILQQVTSTRQHGVTVTGPGGYSRNVLWKNTNELLGIEGYSGIKTGTTDQAGACLVSVGERDGRRLIVVVLGSAASEARYTDSRNLFRWAWSSGLGTAP